MHTVVQYLFSQSDVFNTEIAALGRAAFEGANCAGAPTGSPLLAAGLETEALRALGNSSPFIYIAPSRHAACTAPAPL